MNYKLREYQQNAVDAAYDFLQGNKWKGGLMVLGTGSGKSFVIAELVKRLDGDVLIFQPTKEILEQNFEKFQLVGGEATIYSASLKSKEISRVTFATIGSVIKKIDSFKHFKFVIIDECDVVNARGGMYQKFLRIVGDKYIGLSVFGDSYISLKGDFFERGFVGEIEDAFCELRNKGLNVICNGGLEFIDLSRYNVLTRGFEDGLFVWKKCKKIIRHSRDGVSSTQLKTGFGILGLTNNHSVYVASKNKKHRIKCGNSFRYKYDCKITCEESSDIKIKSILLGDNGNNWGNNNPHKMSKYAYLIGYFLGNGWIDKTRFGFGLHKDFKDELVENLKLSGLGGVHFKTRDGDGNGVELRFNDKSLSKLFRHYQLDNKSYDKHIPADFLLFFSKKARLNLLKGLVDSDGHLSVGSRNRKRVHYTTTSLRLAKTLMTLLISLGIKPSFSPRKYSKLGGVIGGRQIYSRRKSFSVHWSWHSMVGDNSNKKGIRKKFIDSNFFELPLKESSNASCTNYLYDIEVAGHPSFVSNGVLVHNTATPYRLSTDRFGGSILKFITRTRPRIFQKLIYYIQNKELFDNGYLAKIEYYQVNLFDVNRLRLNSTGADYTDESVKAHMREINFSQLLLKVTKRLVYVRKNVLVFTRFITDAEELLRHFPNGAIVTGKTKKKEREQILADFKSGRINLVVNVGTLTVGFDYPELETIVMARPTRSLRLYYQIIGRGIRPHKLKNSMWAVDLCDNYNRFGKIEDLTLTTEKPGMDLWVIKSGSKQLTNRYF